MTEIAIRNYESRDEPAVKEITYRTGFSGEDLRGRKYFNDKHLFYLMFSAYYLVYEPDHCFVAEDCSDKSVIGYIIGTNNTANQMRGFRKEIIPRVKQRAFSKTIWRYPRTFKTFLRMNRMFRRTGGRTVDTDMLKAFPAHLHMNLMPDYQSRGIGSRLLQHFEMHLSGCKVPGIHLQTSNYNKKAVPFYHKMGFALYKEVSLNGHPALDDYRVLIFTKKLRQAP